VSYVTDRVDFPSSTGVRLNARLERPVGTTRAWGIFAHCFTCSKESRAATRIARALAARGIAVLRFDFTGLGQSEGDFANTSFSSNIEDLVAAADFLRTTHGAPALLIGHSLGGAAVLAAAARIPEVRAVASLGAPSDPSHVVRHLEPGLEQIETEGSARIELAGREFTITRQFIDDIRQQNLTATLASLTTAVLVMHSPVDRVVGIQHAATIFAALKHPKSFISLDQADHFLSRAADAEYAADVLAAWASRFLPSPPTSETPEGEVVVTETGEGKFTQAIRAGRHHLTADEPVSSGGLDRGPSPYDLLLASLGACTAMTLRLYAEHKTLPLERITVSLHHHRIHADDCASCTESATGRVDRIERRIRVEGDLDDVQRTRLLEIANRCPVHRTLEGEKEIVTLLAEPLGS